MNRALSLAISFAFACAVLVLTPAASAQSKGPGSLSVYPFVNSFRSDGQSSIAKGIDVRFLENHRLSFGASYLMADRGPLTVHRSLHVSGGTVVPGGVAGGTELIGADYTTTGRSNIVLGTARVNFTKRTVQPFIGFGGGILNSREMVTGSNLMYVPGYETNPNFAFISNQFNTYYAPGLTTTRRTTVMSATAGTNIYIPGTFLAVSPSYSFLFGEGFRAHSFGVGGGPTFRW